MKQFAFFAVAALLVFSQADGAHAGMVSHHSLTVEADGSASECLGCHDGAAATTVSSCAVQCGSKSSHSILKDYPPRGKESEYAPAASLAAKGIRLVDGKVTCISCHNLNNPDKHHLVMDDTGSKLCFACHVKM